MEFVATVATWFTPTTLFLLLNLMIGTIVITSRFGSGSKKIHPPVDPNHAHHAPLTRAPSFIHRVKSINFNLYKFPSPETEIFTTNLDDTGSDPLHNSFPDPAPAPLSRAPSLLDRVKSINLSYLKFPHAPTTQPEFDNSVGPTRLDSPDQSDGPDSPFRDHDEPSRLTRAPSLLERVKSIKFTSFYGSDSTQEPDPNPIPPEDDHKPRRSKSETNKATKTTQKMTKSASEKHVETVEAVERRRPETTRVERSTSFGDGENSVDVKAADFINKFKQQLKLQRLDSILRYRRESQS